jgi:hypothetical protein
MNLARLLLSGVALTFLSATAFAQAETAKAPAPSDAEKSFDKLKSLAGTWQGPVKMDPPSAEMGGDDPGAVQVTFRITSRGNSMVHEMKSGDKPEDPTKYDHPVTMFYLDSDRLLLTHYCDAGNRPRMVGKVSPDGKKIEFDFIDLSGGTQYGHMHHAVFTIIDDNHHSEDWTYMMPGDKPMHAHMDLARAK